MRHRQRKTGGVRSMARETAIVVGGGVMGLAAGCALAGRGVAVTLLERHEIGHDWAASHGLTRAIRHEYGAAALYTDLVARSLPLWDELARETARQLYTATGVLSLGRTDDGHTLAGFEVMQAAGLPIERLSAEECGARFPQCRPEAYDVITYNPTGGMPYGAQLGRALAARLRARGGTIREGAQVRGVETAGDGGRVVLVDGSALHAERVIVAAGAWVADVLPEVALPICITRQQVCYLEGLSPERFAVGAFPVFLASMEYYGFPLQGAGWFKVGSHVFGDTVDPNAGYPPDMAEVEAVRRFLRGVVPGAAAGRLTS